MFSQELYIMDRNMERLMVTELLEKVDEQASALAEKDNALAEQASALAEKDNALAEKDNALAEKDKLIAELKAQLAQQQTSKSLTPISNGGLGVPPPGAKCWFRPRAGFAVPFMLVAS